LGAHQDDVDDIVQEAFLQAFAGLGRLRDPDRFGAWLAGIIRNVSRAAARQAPLMLLADWPEGLLPASAQGLPWRPERCTRLELPPEPVIGLHDAPVMVLAAMPGWAPGDMEYYGQPGTVERAVDDARSLTGSPVRFLDDVVEHTPGGEWWRKLLRGWWREGYEYGDLAKQFVLVQFRGYHSQEWYPMREVLPSQHYSFELVKHAMGRRRVIVLLSPVAAWLENIPELAWYDRLVRVNVPRTASVGPGNLTRAAADVVRRELGPPSGRPRR
jgi:hypothetical protein